MLLVRSNKCIEFCVETPIYYINKASSVFVDNFVLGTGHKGTARVGWSDLGWAMENLWAVSMGRQFFGMSTVGPPNKNPC